MPTAIGTPMMMQPTMPTTRTRVAMRMMSMSGHRSLRYVAFCDQLLDELFLFAGRVGRFGPSALFDAVALLPGAGAEAMAERTTVQDFVSDAFAHQKFIGHDAESAVLFERVGLADQLDDGVVPLDGDSAADFVKACAALRLWDRAVDPT